MGTDSIIYIRTDGNSTIATGHLVRCLCITQALEKLGKKVCFLVSDTTSYELLKDLCNTVFYGVVFSFEVKILESAVYDNLDLEIDELCSLLSDDTNFSNHNIFSTTSQSKPVILVDSYYVTPRYFEALKNVAKIAYMDDLRAFDYDVDLVINYDVIPASKADEYKQAYKRAKVTLLGAEYTPLRQQFQNQTIDLRNIIQNVLITTGGSDPHRFTEAMSSQLSLQNPDLNIHIVVGKLFDNIDSLEKLSKKSPRIHLHQNVKDMAALMKKCDFAISAAGTTLYELCALGIPTISFTFADNQMIMAETFAETGAIPYAGDIRNNSICDIISQHLVKVFNKISDIHKQQIIMHELVDGNGALKITKALCK